MSDFDPATAESLQARGRLQELAGEVDLTGVELLRRVRMAANLYDTILNQRLRGRELTGSRWHLLVRLFAEELLHGTQGMSPTYLSRCHNVSKNTISTLLRGLEEQGLIERALDPADRRIFRIRLSAAGRGLVKATTPQHFRELNELAAGLTPTEQSQLVELLGKLYRSLADHSGLPEPIYWWNQCEETSGEE